MTTPEEAAARPRSEWEARRFMYMRGARTCRRLRMKAERAGLPGAVAYYRRTAARNVLEARKANRAALWHKRNNT